MKNNYATSDIIPRFSTLNNCQLLNRDSYTWENTIIVLTDPQVFIAVVAMIRVLETVFSLPSPSFGDPLRHSCNIPSIHHSI